MAGLGKKVGTWAISNSAMGGGYGGPGVFGVGGPMIDRKARRAATASSRLREKTPTFDPVFLSAFLDEGWALLQAGQEAEALEVAKRVVRLQETAESRHFFVEAVKGWRYFPGAEDFRDVVARAWREAWGAPADLLGVTLGLLEANPSVREALGRATRDWPRRLVLDEIFKGGELAAFAGDPLILAVLESDKNVDLGLERLLTSVRAGLLHVVVSLGAMELPNNTLPLCCALAQQCFINEYVWGLTDKEAEEVAILNDRLTNALQERSPVSPFIVAMLAAYKPLIDVSGARRLLKQALPQAMAQLLDQQLSRPAERLSDEKSIRRLTAINNETSIAVKTQYEENPYPRWVRLAAIEPPQPIDDWFQATFPSSPFRRLDKPEALDVLVAGCGTGHHALLFAKSFPMAHILAIDLSLPSLSYARQKTREIGIDNVEYAQADILEIGNIGRTFDVISSSGVLHHLADPLEGWRRLLSLLRPNGLMHVGLYSELARRNVAAARNWLAESGHPSVETVDDLRRSRQHLLAFAHDHSALADVLRYPDFYSTSEYRDLLFHRQERDFDIPEIGRFLEENKLRFIGFNVGAAVRAEFRRSVSEERESDLTAWHEFETGHPHVFQGMYQFWVQRIEP